MTSDIDVKNRDRFNKTVAMFSESSGREIHIVPGKRWPYSETDYCHMRIGVTRRADVAPRELLVIGTGRCGTTTVSSAFMQGGHQLTHELVGEYGTASHFLVADSDWYPYRPVPVGRAHVGERRNDYEFRKVFHLIREPLACIASMRMNFKLIEYEFLEDCGVFPMRIPESQRKDRLYRAMWMYLYVNLHCEKQTELRFKIEEFYARGFGEMQEIMGLTRYAVAPDVKNASRGYYKPRPVTWDALFQYPHLASGILDMAIRYGYVKKG